MTSKEPVVGNTPADPETVTPMPGFDIHRIKALLPHRYPFLLVDRVIEYVPEKYLLGYKNVTFNEPFFTGHFPVRPVMPGVLICEAMAQVTGLLAAVSRPDEVGNKLYYFVGMDGIRFRRPVEPGDQLMMRAELIQEKRAIWKFYSEARVDGAIAASGEIMCTARDADL